MGGMATSGIEVRHLHPFTGTEVMGLDLAGSLGAGQRSALDRLLAERGVLVFREQGLDARSFARAVEETFGELLPQQLSQFTLPDFPIVGFVSNTDADRASRQRVVRGEQYHTDHSNHPAPPRATALFGVAIPRTGGDTQFANVQAAYDGLPEAMKARIEGLASLHAFQSSRSPRRIATPTPEERARMPETVQPLVVTHPVTGRKGLYLNTARMEGVLGVDRDEADALIAELMGRATHPRYEHRHAWRAGDLVIWDNRTVLHKANGDVPTEERRYLYRVMVKGTPLR